jgi:transposase
MEACGGAHHWARVLQSKGYVVRLIAPQFVKPYVKSNNTDANHAQAVCEAMSRPSMRYVAVKTIEQQDIQAVHRVRASLISEQAAKANQLRGLAYEYGLVAPREIAALRVAVPAWLEDASNGLTVRLRALLSGLYADLRALDERVRELDKKRSIESMGIGTGQAFPHQRRGHSASEQDGAGGLGDVEARHSL